MRHCDGCGKPISANKIKCLDCLSYEANMALREQGVVEDLRTIKNMLRNEANAW